LGYGALVDRTVVQMVEAEPVDQKKLMGESWNAVMIQLFIAMIVYILLRLYHNLTDGSLGKRLKGLLVTVRANLFARPITDN